MWYLGIVRYGVDIKYNTTKRGPTMSTETVACAIGLEWCCGPDGVEGDVCDVCEQIANEESQWRELRAAIRVLADVINRSPRLWFYGDGKGGAVAKELSDALEEKGWRTKFTPWQPRSEVEIIAERDGWDCKYCGTALYGKPDREIPHVDHVHPKSRGGSESLDNKVLACPSCNGSKGAKTLDEWKNR